MRGRYVSDLMRQPWAILPHFLPTISRVLTRLDREEPLSEADRATVDAGQARWEARAKQSAAYPGNVAVIPVYGVLTQRGEMQDLSTPTTSSARLVGAVRQCVADPSIGAIVLDIDSPGGSVYGIEELGDAIMQARAAKPVAAVANSLAASAAYWVGSQASEFYAAPGAEVGSIGVYTMHADCSKALEAEGVAITYISAGKFKTEGNPYAPLGDDARAATQATIDGYYDSFVRAVARGRGASLKSVREGMGQGRVVLPDQAKAENMIDGTATLADVIGKLQARIRRSSAAALRDRAITIQELEG